MFYLQLVEIIEVAGAYSNRNEFFKKSETFLP